MQINPKTFELLRACIFSFTLVCLLMAAGCEDVQDMGSQKAIPTTAPDSIEPADREISDAQAQKAAELNDVNHVDEEEPDNQEAPLNEETIRTVQTIEIPETWKRISLEDEFWIDKDSKEVIIGGHVCLTRGALEMFICPEGSKEHESVISAHAKSHQVHAGLVRLGANPGKTTSWDPEYRAAYGPSIEITLKWKDKETGKVKSVSAKEWIRDFKTKEKMKHQWVFGGSDFWKDPDTGEEYYLGDAGEMICLSNFSTATIDVNVKSSDSNEGLMFEAFTENIPPIGTKVYAIIKAGKRIDPEVVPAKPTAVEPSDTEPRDSNSENPVKQPETSDENEIDK